MVRLPIEIPGALPSLRSTRATAVLFLLVWLGNALSSHASGPRRAPWTQSPFDSAKRHLKRDQVLLVELGATWCEPCNQLAMEILDTPLATDLIGTDVGLRVDFDSDAGQDLKRRYGVLSIPTLLVIHREGYEIGRVEGYPGRREWLDAAREARSGRMGLIALEARAKASPSDAHAALDLAQARLVRKDLDAAMPVLDALIGHSDLAVAARAARVKGRWLLRVSEDAAAALLHFGAMVDRFADTPHEGHFVYWKAEALEALGRRADAVSAFIEWRARRGDEPEQAEAQASFMVHHEHDTEVTLALVRSCLERRRSGEVLHLLSQLLMRRGELPAAIDAAAQALATDPDNALFHNALERLTKP